MKNKLQKIAIAALLSIALISCGDEYNSTGKISGYVYLLDTIGRQLPKSAGITVSIDNTNFSTKTDSLGHFAFTGVPKGVYSINYSKKGFASNKFINLQFIGKDEYFVGQDEYDLWSKQYFWSEKLIQLQTINSISDASVSSSNITDSVSFSCTIHSSLTPTDPANWQTYTSVSSKVFIGKNKSVSSDPESYDIELTSWPHTCYAESTLSGNGISKKTLLNAGYKPGQTVYAILYPDCGITTSYIDIKTNRNIYTSLGTPSEVLSFTVPN